MKHQVGILVFLKKDYVLVFSPKHYVLVFPKQRQNRCVCPAFFKALRRCEVIATANVLACSKIGTRIDYCNSLLAGVNAIQIYGLQ